MKVLPFPYRYSINWGLWIGLLLFLFFLLFPFDSNLNPAARRLCAVAVLMAVWWMTEAIPLAITSLIPLVLYPILGIMKTSQIAPQYMNHLIFLFMGGFFIANAIQKWGLHRRFALRTLYYFGKNAKQLILGFMIVGASLSMWISNTAAAIMLMPIGMAVIKQLKIDSDPGRTNSSTFDTVLMLGIAYSCSIGGTASLIGTPPNLVFAGVFKKFFPLLPEITFAEWILNIFPLSIILLFIVFIYLTKFFLKKADIPQIKGRAFLKEEIDSQGKLEKSPKKVLIIFVITALLWIFRSTIYFGNFKIPGWADLIGLENQIQDSTIAIGMALLLFIVPGEVNSNSSKKKLLVLKDVLNIPWDILLLFGGGFALAEGIQVTGIANYISEQLGFMAGIPLPFLLLLLCLSITFLTEITSNTAIASTFLPIIAAFSLQTNLPPLLLMLPATLSASCAFMLPVATPPNAIVFGTRYVSIKKMVKVGFSLNLITAVTIVVYFLVVNNFL